MAPLTAGNLAAPNATPRSLGPVDRRVQSPYVCLDVLRCVDAQFHFWSPWLVEVVVGVSLTYCEVVG